MTAPEGLLSRIRSGLPGLAWPPIVTGPLAIIGGPGAPARGEPMAAGGRDRGPAASPARGPGDPCGGAFAAFRPPAGGGGAGAPRSRDARGASAPARAAPARDPAGGIGFLLLGHSRGPWAAAGEPHLRLDRRAGDDPADGGQPALLARHQPALPRLVRPRSHQALHHDPRRQSRGQGAAPLGGALEPAVRDRSAPGDSHQYRHRRAGPAPGGIQAGQPGGLSQ